MKEERIIELEKWCDDATINDIFAKINEIIDLLNT